jgi:hypothetical protein
MLRGTEYNVDRTEEDVLPRIKTSEKKNVGRPERSWLDQRQDTDPVILMTSASVAN